MSLYCRFVFHIKCPGNNDTSCSGTSYSVHIELPINLRFDLNFNHQYYSLFDCISLENIT